MNKTLGIIPARSGSKRVQGKNIKILNGKPLIAYTIEAAIESKLIDRLIVSTDCKEIAKIAKNYGAEVPFIRPHELSKDDVPDLPVLVHALEKLTNLDGFRPDIVLNLRPTSPFKTGKLIDKVIAEFDSADIDLVRTMTKTEGVYHPYWMYKVDQNGMAFQFMENININEFYQSQLLPAIYRINGVIDAYRVNRIIDGDILGGMIKSVIINDRESFEIDTNFDFSLCEALFKIKDP